jgi:hypothetical protein
VTPSRSILLVCHAGTDLGIGHLTRMLALHDALLQVPDSVVKLLIVGERLERSDLAVVDHEFVGLGSDLLDSVDAAITASDSGVVVVDIHPRLIPDGFATRAAAWRDRGVRVVGVDALLPLCDSLDVTWVPSLLVPTEATAPCSDVVHFGWDSFIIKPPLPRASEMARRVLVLTGGSDVTHQHETLPALIDSALPDDAEVWWVKGPFAGAPEIPDGARLQWTVHEAPSGLEHLLAECDYALTVFGVTFFELLQSGVPTVVFSPYEDREFPELEVVADADVAIVAGSAPEAVLELAELSLDPDRAAELAAAGAARMAVNGADRLARLVHSLSE